MEKKQRTGVSRIKNFLLELSKDEISPPGCLKVEGAVLGEAGAFSFCGIEKILACHSDRVTLLGKNKRIFLSGEGLECLCFRFQTVEVRGHIAEISFEKREGK